MNKPASLLTEISEQIKQAQDTAESLIRQLPPEVQNGLWDQAIPISPSMRKTLEDFVRELVDKTKRTDALFSALCAWMQEHPEAALVFLLDETMSGYSLLHKEIDNVMNEATNICLRHKSQEENLFPLFRKAQALCQYVEDFSPLLRSTLKKAETV